ncbi:hypothetical protein L3C95_27865 [Chitinophaga filiformis]|uniref:DUF6929 family protein n=1 Tax=Chitinophaga filiformis TaxID=104663 RepID=UPI001F32A4BB|nr:hypothetical protein [Chitinophaga filiformis]MCF6406746.1 hypothetical protein [Chitinophaga filiformis]
MKAIITLLKSLLLSAYPSGSSIDYYNGHLYIIGDDANILLVLDSNYNEVSTVPFFDYKEKRIPKVKKADLESAVILDIDGEKSLLALGSAATKERETGVVLRLRDNKVQHISYAPFVNRLRQIPEINIEGATIAGPHLMLANRGNKNNPVNNIITTTPDFWQRQEDAPISISQLIIPFSLAGFAGISELCYIEQEDILLVVLSSENTGNAYDDGTIGDSYIGWIKNVSRKLNKGDILLDGIVNLSDVDPVFKGEKLEGVCLAEATDNGWYLHLVADNDQGESRLFHIKILLGD